MARRSRHRTSAPGRELTVRATQITVQHHPQVSFMANIKPRGIDVDEPFWNMPFTVGP